jgi:hypothetical protein
VWKEVLTVAKTDHYLTGTIFLIATPGNSTTTATITTIIITANCGLLLAITPHDDPGVAISDQGTVIVMAHLLMYYGDDISHCPCNPRD